MAVIHASPNLASHAPNVKIMITNINQVVFIRVIIIRMMPSTIASKANKTISRCCRWIIAQTKAIMTSMGDTDVIQEIIACRRCSISGLQDQRFVGVLALHAVMSDYEESIFGVQSQYFNVNYNLCLTWNVSLT